MINDIPTPLLRGLTYLLEGWADWQRQYYGVRGFREEASGCAVSGCSSFDDLVDAMEEERFEAIDASIDDLVPSWRAAIYRRYGIAAIFRFPRENYWQCLQSAHDRLLVVLPKKNVLIPMR